MAGGGWDVGTWDSAQWNSLPVSGNSATGSVGDVGKSASPSLTGVAGAGQVGSAGATLTLALSGVQATGAVGSETESDFVAVTGVAATGQAGDVGRTVTLALSGVSAAGDVGTVTAVLPVIVFDTHDGDDRQKRRFEREAKERDRRKAELVAVYEQLVEGKPELASEIVAPFAIKRAESDKIVPANVDFDRLLSDLRRVELLYAEHQEMDDEEALLLL